LTPPKSEQTGWTESVLYSFLGADGAYPIGGVIADRNGALYGTTNYNGFCDQSGCGTVFKLTPPPPGKTAWSEATLHRFRGDFTSSGEDGANPAAGLIGDAQGALYGTTPAGGSANCYCGIVFKLTPPTTGKGSWTESVLHTFSGLDGASPSAGLIAAKRGILYGTTGGGGKQSKVCLGGCGTVFSLSPLGKNGWMESVVHGFDGADGRSPSGALLDADGILYSTTSVGGTITCSSGCGTVFQIKL
jgi:uncharacterized repeat protein (TIGR03803 family)